MRRILAVVLVASLALCAGAAHAKKRSKKKGYSDGTASKDTIELVETFLKLDTAVLPAEAIPEFMEVDRSTLPSKLRDPYQAKRIELLALRKIAEGKRKPLVRRIAFEDKPAVCEAEKGTPLLLKSLKRMGFMQLTEDEVMFLQRKTKCSECELQEEFTLMVVMIPGDKKKKKPAERHYLISGNDPLTAYIAVYRSGRENTIGTAFFGIGMKPVCR